MNTINIKRTIKGLGLATAMVLGLIVVSGTTASAQYRGDRDRDNGNYRGGQVGDYNNRNFRVDRRQIKAAYDRGYQMGFQEGVRESRNRRGSYGNNGGYGNNGSWGNNGGYGNNGSWGNNGGYNNGNYQLQEAFQKGFRKGYDEGVRRGRNNRRGSIWPF